MVQDIFNEWFRRDEITLVFQPIVELTSTASVFAFEALTRGPSGTQFQDATVLFDYLRRTRQEVRADRHCVAAAIRAAAPYDVGAIPRLSVNVHPTTIERDLHFAEFLGALLESEGLNPTRVIVEVVEESRYASTRALSAGIAELRALGLTIALDDVGIGDANYRTIIDVEPDILKIDRYFVHLCAEDRLRRAVVASVQHLADAIGAVVVAEGVERDEDAAVVRDLGIRYAQGYRFSRPQPLAELVGSYAFEERKRVTCPERRFSSSMTPTRF